MNKDIIDKLNLFRSKNKLTINIKIDKNIKNDNIIFIVDTVFIIKKYTIGNRIKYKLQNNEIKNKFYIFEFTKDEIYKEIYILYNIYKLICVINKQFTFNSNNRYSYWFYLFNTIFIFRTYYKNSLKYSYGKKKYIQYVIYSHDLKYPSLIQFSYLEYSKPDYKSDLDIVIKDEI